MSLTIADSGLCPQLLIYNKKKLIARSDPKELVQEGLSYSEDFLKVTCLPRKTAVAFKLIQVFQEFFFCQFCIFDDLLK